MQALLKVSFISKKLKIQCDEMKFVENFDLQECRALFSRINVVLGLEAVLVLCQPT